jgi:hypothetical protein
MLNKKKFRDEDENILEIKLVNENKPKPNKNYLFNKNTEEEITKILVHNTSTVSKNFIKDYRIFDVHNSIEKIFIYNLNNNPNQNLVLFFNQSNFEYIDILREFKQDSNFFNEMSINEKETYFLDCTEKLLESLSNQNKSCEKSKYILYLDSEENDLFLFIILNFLKKLVKHNHHNMISIITNKSIMCVLSPGMNTLLFSENLFTKKGLGLLPLEKSIISTKGLRWDLLDWETDFGSINLSTSNEFLEDECSIFVHSGNIAFTAEININKINNY